MAHSFEKEIMLVMSLGAPNLLAIRPHGTLPVCCSSSCNYDIYPVIQLSPISGNCSEYSGMI